MQARGVKHNRTLYVLRQQRKGRGVTMVSTNNDKKSSWKQVRRSDQLRYPIHNRSFIAHGRLWMPCAPASTIKDKNQGYSLSEPAGSVSLEQTVTHTNRPLWACFLPIWCIHRPMIPRLWIYTSIASVPRLWTFCFHNLNLDPMTVCFYICLWSHDCLSIYVPGSGSPPHPPCHGHGHNINPPPPCGMGGSWEAVGVIQPTAMQLVG